MENNCVSTQEEIAPIYIRDKMGHRTGLPTQLIFFHVSNKQKPKPTILTPWPLEKDNLIAAHMFAARRGSCFKLSNGSAGWGENSSAGLSLFMRAEWFPLLPQCYNQGHASLRVDFEQGKPGTLFPPPLMPELCLPAARAKHQATKLP